MFPQSYNSLGRGERKSRSIKDLKSKRDRLLSIVRGLEIELADSYTPKEVDRISQELETRERTRTRSVEEGVGETKSIREKVAEIVSLEKEKRKREKRGFGKRRETHQS